MLILTRRVGESVLIGDDIEVCVLEVKGNQVRIGIQAPNDVEVLREELVERDPSLEGPPEIAQSGYGEEIDAQ